MKMSLRAMFAVIFSVGMLTMVAMPVGAISVTEAAKVTGVNQMAATCGTFLGFYPWYEGISSNCKDVDVPASENDLPVWIWTIVLNILADMTLAVGYIAIGTTIWGGFYMITSNGDPGKVVKARKILTAGIAGSLIAILATVIVRAIVNVITTGSVL